MNEILGEEWSEIKYSNGFPPTSGRDNSTFENVYIFCEHVNTSNSLTLIMTPFLARYKFLIYCGWWEKWEKFGVI